jgi:hypothetical protein
MGAATIPTAESARAVPPREWKEFKCETIRKFAAVARRRARRLRRDERAQISRAFQNVQAAPDFVSVIVKGRDRRFFGRERCGVLVEESDDVSAQALFE